MEVPSFKIFVESLQGLPLTQVTFKGINFKTGTPVRFPYVRNTEKSGNFGAQFQQNIEPAGRFMLLKEVDGPIPPGWEEGEMVFQSPLVIHFNTTDQYSYDESNWKMQLYQHYGKKGIALSRAIKQDGYDGIVTVKGNEVSEIVDLTVI